MNLKNTCYFGVFFFLITHSLSSQSFIIHGMINDSGDSTGIPFVSVILYYYNSPKIINYTQSNENGEYTLTGSLPVGAYTLRTQRLGYIPTERVIAIIADSIISIPCSFSLDKDITELKEVVIQEKPPIVVKKDTIIFDIQHWTEIRDKTLEEVLAKIPGFSISESGDISINGQLVNKVLINGEEIANAGAALITKSLSPEDVESIELRTDEKENKLKESLLDANNFVVLDIKLKSNLEKSGFGKIRTTNGYNQKWQPGGYVNLFSLKEKWKNHFFTERDGLGEETIPLSTIKNIGEDAVTQWFREPADYQEVYESPSIQNELYGIAAYTQKQHITGGISSKWSIAPFLDIYFGSYTSFNTVHAGKNYTQNFSKDSIINYSQEQVSKSDLSKNKLDIRINTKKIKTSLNVNGVWENKDYLSNNYSEEYYIFSNNDLKRSYYINYLFEYAINKHFGWQLKLNYSRLNNNQTKNLNHNSILYASSIIDDDNNSVYSLEQQTDNNQQNLLGESFIQYRGKSGTLNAGLSFKDEKQHLSNKAYNSNSTNVPLFSGDPQSLQFILTKPYISHHIRISKINLSNTIGYNLTRYPTPSNSEHKKLWEYQSEITFIGDNFNHLIISFSRKLGDFPLNKLINGYILSDFQSIYYNYSNQIQPVPEYSGKLLFGLNLSSIHLRLDPSLIFGKSFSNNQYLTTNNPFINVAFAQLPSEYLIVSFPIIHNFNKIPFKLTWEPEWLGSKTMNKLSDLESYYIHSNIYMLGAKAGSQFKYSDFNFEFYPKYTVFRYVNDYYQSTSNQKMLSFTTSLKMDICDNKLLLTFNNRNVYFFGKTKVNYLNFGGKIEYPGKVVQWTFEGYNLLDNKHFIQNNIYPSYFIQQTTFVFGRYFKLSATYKF